MATKRPQPGTKSRSGCRTCKVRRVKCDERFPICHRCFTTGRKCDGYGIWGGGGYRDGRNTETSNNVDPSEQKTFARVPFKTLKRIISIEEQLSLDWFVHRTSLKLPGAFKSVFWNRMLLQVGSTEPAVLHAILALSSTHRRASLGSADSSQPNIFALQQYAAALNCLQPYFGEARREYVRMTLVSCLVFIYFELLQSHYRTALVHVEHGLRLLKYQSGPAGHGQGVEVPSFEARMNDMFRRLYVQARLFGQQLQASWLSSRTAADHAEPEFLLTNNQAKQSLDRILLEIIFLRDKFRALCPKPYTKTYSTLQTDQLKLSARLALWRKSYQPVFDITSDRPIVLDYFAQRLLHIYHTMSNIMVMASISTDEAIYNSYTDSFVAIILQAIEIYKVAFAKRPTNTKYGAALGHNERKPKTADSVVDIGWVTPLYFTVLKCRHWPVRNRALRLLKSAPHKEGLLDSGLAAIVAEKVMELEGQLYCEQDESGLLDTNIVLDSDAKKFSHFAASVPASQMIQDVIIQLPEHATGNFTIECHRNQSLGGKEELELNYDAMMQTWTSRA